MIYCLAIRNLFFFLEFVQAVDKMWEYKMKNPSFFYRKRGIIVEFLVSDFYLAKLTARVSRMTVIFTCPG